MNVLTWIAASLLAIGGTVCCINFYLSFLRYPLYRLRRGRKEDYKFVSGFPVVGSLFVGLAMLSLRQTQWVLVPAIALIVIDTGGLHCFLAMMCYHGTGKKQH